MNITNLLKPNGYMIHQKVSHLTIVHAAHFVFMCFVFI